MIISNHMSSVLGAYASQQRTGAPQRPQSRTSGEAGEFVLSQTGQNFSAVLQKARAASDVRAARVAELERSIADGTYKVDADKVAASLLAMRY